MSQEFARIKELLLKDLCARLPYGVQYKDAHGYKMRINIWSPEFHTALNTILYDEKPSLYLRPMSSMTEEERKMFWEELDKDMDILESNIDAPIICEYNGRMYRGNPTHHEIDFLNRNMFDWRGLIPMGLAIEAPEGMYSTKTE